MTLFTSIFILSGMLGPIISGVMTTNVGWRSFWWFNVATQVTLLVLLLFFLPETKFARVAAATPLAGPAEAVESSNMTKPENSTGNTAHTELGRLVTAEINPTVGKGAPSRRQFPTFVFPKLGTEPLAQSLARDVILPFRLLFTFPIIWFSSLIFTLGSANYIMLNLTQSEVFGAPPYNMSSQSIGFTNFASGIGCLFGLFSGGYLSDAYARRMTLRNGGIREPEMRLPALIPYCVIALIGALVASLGYVRLWSWKVIVIVGYSFLGVQVAAIPGIVIAYAVDSYKPASAEFMVAATMVKNSYAYGFSYCTFVDILKLAAGANDQLSQQG